MILDIILRALLIYISLTIIIPFLIFPNYLRKWKIEKNEKIKVFANKFKSKNKEKTLKRVYNFIIRKYRGNDYYKLDSLIRLFVPQTFENLIKEKRFLWCHSQNLLMKTLLINTTQFKESNIAIKYVIDNKLAVHQYMVITLENQKKGHKEFRIDPFRKVFEEL